MLQNVLIGVLPGTTNVHLLGKPSQKELATLYAKLKKGMTEA